MKSDSWESEKKKIEEEQKEMEAGPREKRMEGECMLSHGLSHALCQDNDESIVQRNGM